MINNASKLRLSIDFIDTKVNELRMKMYETNDEHEKSILSSNIESLLDNKEKLYSGNEELQNIITAGLEKLQKYNF